jgi:hypothetical protein
LEPLKTVGLPIPWQPDLTGAHRRKPALKTFQQFTVEHRASDLQEQMSTPLGPAHVPDFSWPSSDQAIDRPFHGAGGNSPAFSPPSTIIDCTGFVRLPPPPIPEGLLLRILVQSITRIEYRGSD